MSRTYPALEIQFPPDAKAAPGLTDRVLAGLDEFAPTAVEESPGTWRVFFESAGGRDGALSWVRSFHERLAAQPLDVPDEDWAARSQADLQPIRAGRLIVSPPWAAAEARAQASDTGGVALVVNPSMGFGTGHHASTRLCLRLLQECSLAGRSVLDIGTGSGVLAIAAALLGAASVAAIDNDTDALAAARENAGLNPLAVPIDFAAGDFRRSRPAPADVVLANLTGEMLRRAAADVAQATAPGGQCIVSGVLAEERNGVVTAFENAGLEPVQTLSEDEWVGVRFRRS